LANGNATFRHSNVALLGLTETLAPNEVTSQEFDERLADTLSSLGLPQGLLQRVAGVYARRNWDQPHQFAEGAITAGRQALAESGVPAEAIGLMVNTSVTREHLEPSVAVGVHAGIGLGPQAMNFDIANACLGFVNGLTLAANMIDAGQLEYSLILAGGVTRAATQHHALCVGDHNGMFTDTKGLLSGGMELVVAAWEEAHETGWDWREMDRYVMHQVSDVHTNSITKAANLDPDRIPV